MQQIHQVPARDGGPPRPAAEGVRALVALVVVVAGCSDGGGGGGPEYGPIPEPDAILAWWRARESEFDPQRRYLAGRPFDAATLLDALHRAPARRRHDLAFELGVRSGGRFLLETRALSHVQFDRLVEFERQPALHSIDVQRALAIPRR